MVKMLEKTLQKFARDESAAITVDWVVLTSGVVLLGTVVLTVIAGGISSGANSINDTVDEYLPTSRWQEVIK